MQPHILATFDKFQVFIRFDKKSCLNQWSTLSIHENDFVKRTKFFSESVYWWSVSGYLHSEKNKTRTTFLLVQP